APPGHMIIRHLLASLLVALGACTDGGPDVEERPPSEATLAASKLAILAVGIATGEEGRSFFDNFLPCPRRGIIDYSNTDRGRRAHFHGCDAGEGIVFDGPAEIRWTSPGGDRTRIETIDLAGNLQVRVAGGTPGVIGGLGVTGIAFASMSPGAWPSVLSLVTSGVRVTAFGASTPLDPRATPASVFAPIVTPDAIPNPGGAPSVLSDADLRRLSQHGALAIASILLNETMEVARGPHGHTQPCGTMQVAIDAARNLPQLTMSWNACPLGPGLYVSGGFSAEWVELSQATGRMAMQILGSITFGGGLPTTTLSRLEWNVTGLGAFPRTIDIGGRLVGVGNPVSFSHAVLVDD
ncbi:MAG TPA: hypothetical protein VEA99_03170, partial [Gemmatimonadaceae bacterium]|nr:hypothetical protein [Gemmatimonadaceae bacterium]